jgi:GAF domain-containing protein
VTQHTGNLSDTFAGIARELRAEPDVEHTLERTVTLAVETIEGCNYAGISLARAGRGLDTPAATHEIVVEADALQYELGEGPCLSAIREQESFQVDDLAADDRWPRWSPRAVELGLRSMLSFQLFVGKDTLGALNLYSGQPAAFDADDRAVGHIFASHAAIALASALTEQHLTRALENRNVIGQAQGILMERFKFTAAQAFELLRRTSQAQNVKLSRVAQHLVESGRMD